MFQVEPLPHVLLVFGIYGYGALLIAGGLSGGFGRHTRKVAYAGVVLLLAFIGFVAAPSLVDSGIRTDSIIFTRYSAGLLLQGENPYTAPMLQAYEYIPLHRSATVRVDSSMVNTFSYPAMAVYVFIPQMLLGGAIQWTILVFLAAVFVFLVRESPDWMVLAPFTFLFASTAVMQRTLIGFTGAIWVLPLLFSMKYWRSWRELSMVFLGVSFAVKQVPWVTALFLGLWVLHEEGLEGLKVPVLYGGGTFLLLNLPFILWSPVAWTRSVMNPLFGAVALVNGGIGLSAVAQTTVFSVPKGFFTFAMLGFLGFSLLVYWLYFERLKWMAWVMPAFVLWFNYRFFIPYFVFFMPVVYYAFLLKNGLVREEGWWPDAA